MKFFTGKNMPIRYSKMRLQDKLAVQQGVHLTAFGVGMLAFLAGFVFCWLAFVR